jgi:DNA-binding GntR family transcriptional regulator
MHGLMLTHRREFEQEHRAMLDALNRRNPDEAARLLDAHLAGAASLLIGEMARTVG